MSAAGWLIGCFMMISIPALLYHLYGWAHLTSTAKSTRIGAVVEGSATASAPGKGRPLEALVPKLVNLFRNKVVRSFLLPWLCDTLAFIMVIGSIGYFIRAVIRPEYAETPVDCNAGMPIFGYDSASWRCQNRAVTSLLLTLIMISAVLAGVLWHYLSNVIGTVRAWQMGSLVSALSILTLVFSAKRDQTSKALGLGLLMGIGVGSRFLSEVVVIEVIHYYEFISGYQYQHTFAMLKLQLIKLSVVLMQILPIAVYYEVKFNPNPPMYEKTPLHTGQESSLAQVFAIAIPCVLSAASFLLKMQFRLVDDEQFDLTAEGIRALYHRKEVPAESVPAAPPVTESPGSSRKSKRGESAKVPAPAPAAEASVYGVDPTSGIHYPAAVLNYTELLGAQLFSHFADTQCTIDYHSCAHSQSPYIGTSAVSITSSFSAHWGLCNYRIELPVGCECLYLFTHDIALYRCHW
jgi:Na+/melibiose symporter-like transporter